jgi:hypothetical protein
LTVGESAGSLERGGIIDFTVRERKLRFEVNQDAALQSRIELSAKLLQLAVSVRKSEH